MIPFHPETLLAIIVGAGLGFLTGRWLWQNRHVALSPWPIIFALAVVGLVSQRLFTAISLADLWQLLFFPLVVGWGAGLAVNRRY
ncbi:MAG TPA: hypothetical protein VFZ25_05925 [Chloroflexota bacterium]|nr:hypothetical protein [Chloroflexota bacterium]